MTPLALDCNAEAEKLYRDLPHWVTDNLEIGASEIAADLAFCRSAGTTDVMRDDLFAKGRVRQREGETNAAVFYVEALDKLIVPSVADDAEEKTKVVRMRCPKCGDVLCREMLP